MNQKKHRVQVVDFVGNTHLLAPHERKCKRTCRSQATRYWWFGAALGVPPLALEESRSETTPGTPPKHRFLHDLPEHGICGRVPGRLVSFARNPPSFVLVLVGGGGRPSPEARIGSPKGGTKAHFSRGPTPR